MLLSVAAAARLGAVGSGQYTHTHTNVFESKYVFESRPGCPFGRVLLHLGFDNNIV